MTERGSYKLFPASMTSSFMHWGIILVIQDVPLPWQLQQQTQSHESHYQVVCRGLRVLPIPAFLPISSLSMQGIAQHTFCFGPWRTRILGRLGFQIRPTMRRAGIFFLFVIDRRWWNEIRIISEGELESDFGMRGIGMLRNTIAEELGDFNKALVDRGRQIHQSVVQHRTKQMRLIFDKIRSIDHGGRYE